MTRPHNPLVPKSLRKATQPVFHYTSAAGLIGMVGTGRVWASQASGLNDLAEVRRGWDLIDRWLQAQPTSATIDLLCDFAADPLQEAHEIFILSGSTAADDANQWRLYAESARGYAVEFDLAVELVAISNAPAPLRSPSPFSIDFSSPVTVSPWFHVLYTDVEAEDALEELVAVVESEWHAITTAAADPEDYDVRYQEFKGEAYQALATVAHLIKTPGFSGENEVRVVTSFLTASEHIHHRAGATGIVGYAELTSAPSGHDTSKVLRPMHGAGAVDASLPVKSVRLGPLLNKGHRSTVRAFLDKNDLATATVSSSLVALR